MRSCNSIVMVAGWVCTWGLAHAGQTASYTYDALGRLTGVQTQNSSGGGTTQIFSFDAAGNRNQYQVLMQVTLGMRSGVVNLTSAGANLTVNISDPSATGTVTFTENGAFLGSTAVAGGQASLILQGFAKGIHTITASYSGDGTHAPQTTTFTVKVQDLGWLHTVLDLLLQ